MNWAQIVLPLVAWFVTNAQLQRKSDDSTWTSFLLDMRQAWAVLVALGLLIATTSGGSQ